MNRCIHVAFAFEIRRATAADVEAIGAAHVDSIQSIGPRFYPADVVREWCAIDTRIYREAMAAGEVFFIAVVRRPGGDEVLGFSSHHVDDGQHGVAVYVRGIAARRGIGSALLRTAESAAVAAGARSVQIDASLAAVDFYKRLGFVETGCGEHRLRSGQAMACVFMTKDLPRVGME